jgi:Uma2 family endonuclease
MEKGRISDEHRHVATYREASGMALTQTLTEIEYPESDGLPMGETDLHIWWMIRIRDQLKYRYRRQHVYVGSNLLVYPVENDPKTVISPDVFVVHDCDPGMRNTFLTWREDRVPNVVFEITSKSTRKNDQVKKPKRYAQMGVQEIILFDPTHDYLKPPLQVLRLCGESYEQVEADSRGGFSSEVLNVTLYRDDDQLVLLDADTESPLLTFEEAAEEKAREAEKNAKEAEKNAREAEKNAREAEKNAREAEAKAREAEANAREVEANALEVEANALEVERRATQAEAEIERLRALLRQNGLLD